MVKTDIVDRLRGYAEANDMAGLYTEASCAYDAIQEIERLRSALRKIGFDYVELSHDKVQLLYLKHMSIARKAFMDSFPPDTDKPSDSPLDDNF
jgi:hypothetical protein